MADTSGSKIKSWVWGNKEFQISVTFAQHLRGLPGQKLYPGIDVDMPVGTPLYAPFDGTVYQSSRQPDGAEAITLQHKDHFTQYAHLNQRAVAKGAKVKQGQLIGYSGNTGVSSAPHLHFALINSATWDGKRRVEPYDYLLKVPNPNSPSATTLWKFAGYHEVYDPDGKHIPSPAEAAKRFGGDWGRLVVEIPKAIKDGWIDTEKQLREDLASERRITLARDEDVRKLSIEVGHFGKRAEEAEKLLKKEREENEAVQGRMASDLIVREKRIEELLLLVDSLTADATLGKAVKTLVEATKSILRGFYEKIRR